MNYDKLIQRRERHRRDMMRQSEEMMFRIKEKGIPVFKRYGIRRVILFGSIIRQNLSKFSDLDMLVIPLENERYWDFNRELEGVLKIPLDIYTQNDDPGFVEKIKSRGETIYEA